MKDLRVIYLDTSNDLVKFGFGSTKKFNTISGATNLVQKVTICLLTELGSNYFSPSYGSSLPLINKSIWSSDNLDVMKATITTAVIQVEDSIKKEQAKTPNLDPTETLASLTINSIEYQDSSASWLVQVSILNETGQNFTITI